MLMIRCVIVSALLLANHAAAAEFSIPDSAPQTGSHINRASLRSPLPFDKVYEELTTEQKALLRSKYIGLRAEDEPPYPLSGMGEVSRQVSNIQRRLLIEGMLILTVRVSASGEGESVAIYESPDERASQAVAFAAMKVKYKPGKCAGVPCDMDFPYSFHFTLR